jgi:predicted membrane protein
MPFLLQTLWAIVLDNCNFQRVGKRKTTIIMAGTIIAIITFVESFYIRDYIYEKNLSMITSLGLVIMFFLTFI